MMSHPPYERAIARVERDGTVLGAAFLVSDWHLLTCGHVVGRKDDHVELVFLANPSAGPIPARVEAFVGDDEDDVAVIRLYEPVTETAATPLALWTTTGDVFHTIGFPDDRLEGDPVIGKILGSTLNRQVKLEVTSHRWIVHKFSGTGVWSNTHQAIVGMVVSYYSNESTAYMIPMGRIAELVPSTRPAVPAPA